jgi:AmmeMemoRadiSam system protein B
MTLPALRALDVFPVEQAGQRFFCLRDPAGFVDEQLLLSPQAFFIACHLDGQNDVTDIQHIFARQFHGQLLLSQELQGLIASLDNHGFLHTEQFVALRRQVEETFTRAEMRPAYLAGKSYPDQAGQLRAFLESFFYKHGGPGAGPTVHDCAQTSVPCLIAPHIDFHRGGHAYAHGYLRLFRHGPPELVLLFGVAHMAPPVPFILTKKHFATPFGTLETDQDIVRRLAAACRWDPYAYEIVHRTEHSLEFQAVMLAYLFGPQVRIVPILCGTFGPELASTTPVIPESVTTFLATCRDLVRSSPQRMCVIAGADLAHVGRRFGDAFDIDETVVQAVHRRDHEDLLEVVANNPDGFYQSVMQDRNQRRVCGLNCIYAALHTVHGMVRSGELLHYDYAHDPAGGIVSFANVFLV